jgi:uncharacterized tellurite resistance protein B-like protein
LAGALAFACAVFFFATFFFAGAFFLELMAPILTRSPPENAPIMKPRRGLGYARAMSKRTPNFASVLTPSSKSEDQAPLRGDEIAAVLELGFLMANADGQASFDELESFRALVKHLTPDAKVSDLFDQLSAKLDKAESIEERVRAVAPLLARPAAADLAYKAVYTIAVFDLETNEAERDLDDLLVEVLGLAARVDDLDLEVNEALNNG